MFSLCFFVTIICIFCPCSGEDGLLHAYSPGDIIIGGLVPVHTKTNRSTTPGPLSCSDDNICHNENKPGHTEGSTGLHPRISYAATSELLSEKMKFPTFLRTITSDRHQTIAIAKLVDKFNWKTVAIIGSDDEYGRYGSDSLKQIFETKHICNEFTDILTDSFSGEPVGGLVNKIRNSSAEAIILFTKFSHVKIIIEAAINHTLNRTWIASDSWSTSVKIFNMSGIEKAGQVFGFISKRNEVPGFKDYVNSSFNGTTNSIIEHYLTHCQTNNQQQCVNQSSWTDYIDQDYSYNIYLAVQVIVEGLRNLLKCDNHHCEGSPNFTALELLKEIKKVNFTVGNTHINFNSSGDPTLGYDIVYWNMSESKDRHIVNVGEYFPNEEITIREDLVITVNVTAYNCFKTCDAGQELKEQGKKCCTQCVKCEQGAFSTGDGKTCESCGEEKYSSDQRDKCLNKTEEFLQWSDPFVIILTSLEVCGIIVTAVFIILFAIYRRTPLVKSVGGYLCFLELFSLLACFCLAFTFTGKPTKLSCMLGIPFFGIAFSLCISCILANLLQILVGFNFDLNIGSWWKKVNRPVAVVTIVSGIQVALCVPWLCLYPPTSVQQQTTKTILCECEKGSRTFFIAMLGYNAFLALICFLFAFKGKQLPDLYKNASLITTSMVLFLIIWTLFIPIYINLTGKYKQAIECAAILISSYSILCCHLAPKCYIMLFRKEINNENAITEYIRKHYEQRDMAVLKS
ncbi:hypothetical protein L3Q82_026793 [Scortum barcoo]|uniref:Uncharacterized protein n=1 Tax=Scortum barcoo TaxID=214431 RepID=A0ACB8WJJ2_9TELE|nr:hypothetical protein L3Q82_026793 [Scortum barcoo]